MFQDLGDRYNEATSLTGLGDAQYAAADPRAARNAWLQAQTILDDLEHPDATQIRAKLAGLDPPTNQTAP